MAKRAERQPKGCFFYGFITGILVLIGILAGVYFGTRRAVQYAVETYTTNAPALIPNLHLSPPEEKAIASSLEKKARAALRTNGPGEILLDETNLNVLIAQSPDLAPYRNEIYLRPEGDELRAFLSLPLDQFAPWKEFTSHFRSKGWTGRYLNAMALIDLNITNATLKVQPKKVIVHATTLPDDFVKRFPWNKLTEEANRDPQVQAVLARIKDIRVEQGQVHVRLR